MYQHVVQLQQRHRVLSDIGSSSENSGQEDQDDMFACQKVQKGATGKVAQPWKYQLPQQTKAIPQSPLQMMAMKIVHINGINTCQSANNVFFVKSGKVVFSASCIGIVMNPQDRSQSFFGGGPVEKGSPFHKFDIISLDYCPALDLVATGSCGKNPQIRVWNPSSLKCQSKFSQGENTGAVSVLRFSSSGVYLFSVDRSKKVTLRVFETKSGKQLCSAKLNEIVVDASVGVGQKLYLASNKGLILYEYIQKKLKRTLINKEVVTCVTVTQKNQFVMGNIQGEILKSTKRRACHSGSVSCLTDFKSKIYSSGELDCTVRIMDYQLNTLQEIKIQDCARSISSMNDCTVVSLRTGKLVFLSMGTQKTLINAHWAGQLWGLTYNKLNHQIITAGDDNKVIVFNLQKKEVVNQIIINHSKAKQDLIISKYSPYSTSQQSRAVAYNPPNQDLAFLCLNGELQVYQTSHVHDPKLIRKLSDTWSEIMRYSPDGLKLCIAFQNGKILILDSDQYKTMLQIEVFKDISIKNLDWSEDSRLLRVSSKNHQVSYFELPEGKSLKVQSLKETKWASFSKFSLESSQIWNDILAPDFVNQITANNARNALAVGSNDGCVKIYSFPAKKGLFTDYKAHSQRVINLEWCKDDKHLFTVGGYDKALVIWRITI